MAYCRNCGKRLPEDAFFCPSCGTKCEPVEGAKREEPMGAASAEASDSLGETVPRPAVMKSFVTAEPACSDASAPRSAAPAEPVASAESKPDPEPAPQAKGGKAPRKGGKAKIAVIAVIALALAGGAMAFASGALAPEEASVEDDGIEEPSEESKKNPKPSSDESKGDDLTKERYEDLYVDDVVMADDVLGRPGVRFKLINNRDEVAKDVSIKVYGTYKVTDNYGDEQLKEDEIGMATVEYGSTHMPFVYPGVTDVELIPFDADGVVASHKNTYDGDAKEYHLEDMESVRVEVTGGSLASIEDFPKIDEDDYKIEMLTTVDDYNNPTLSVRVTNLTDYRWRKVRVYLVGVDKNGEIARKRGYSGIEYAYRCTGLSELYFNPGETKEIKCGYRSDLDVDHFEVTRVVVEKEVASDGE